MAPPNATTAVPQPLFVPELDCSQPGPVFVQPAPQWVPVYPPHSTVVPLPSHAPGSVFGPPLTQPLPGAWGNAPVPMPGPAALPQPPVAATIPGALPQPPVVAVAPGLANPIAVPVVDEELAWDQIVDVASDYFTVAREQRARRGGEVWSEGRIETAPQDGATWLEPHRGDSVGAFNRWESTFQTIRRRAVVRVIPDATGYLVEVIVEKELEDLPTPEKATAGAATFRNDGSLPSHRLEEVSRTSSSPRWIHLGRDPALEQRMLADIQARLTGVTVSQTSAFVP
ncbi:MAG: hypothetical protein WD738_06220 [Pirellulales bacterium]